MYPFKRIMIGLDFSFIDEALIRYTNSICRLLKPEALYFVHVHKDLTDKAVSDETGEIIPVPLDEVLVKKMQDKVSTMLDLECSSEVYFQVLEGQPAEYLLRWSHIKQIDLFISGIKAMRNGSGMAPQRFAMLSDCSILFVPELGLPELTSVLIPVDFSAFSASVVKSALKIQQQVPGSKLLLLHVYDVPIGYYKTGKSYEEFADIMHFNATQAYYRFCRDLKIDPIQLPCRFTLCKKGNIAAGIMASVQEIQPSLLLMGSQGRTAVSSIFIGSIAEKVVRLNQNTTMLVLKQKGKNLGLLDAIFANE